MTTTPRPVESREDRIRHATTEPDITRRLDQARLNAARELAATTEPYAAGDAAPRQSFATYLDREERNQLDARAAAAEQERDDALDDRDSLRRQLDNLHEAYARATTEREQARAEAASLRPRLALARRSIDGLEADLRSQTRALREALAERDQARETVHHDIARQLDILAADPAILRDWLTTCQPQPTGFGELLQALAEKLRRGDAPVLGSVVGRAQDPTIRPAAWEQHATDAITDAWTHVEDDAAVTAQRLAEMAVRAIIDAGLAGPGGRCRQCGATFPRTLPAGQDPLCWTCDSAEQTCLDEPDLWQYGRYDHDDQRVIAYEGTPRLITPRVLRRPLTATGPWTPATIEEPPPGCPATVWDGPSSFRCGLGAKSGVCAVHGRFRPAEGTS